MYWFCYPKASFFENQSSEFHGYLLSPFLLFCPKVWDPICWEDIYVSFQPSFVSSVISDEPTCLAILRKIMASPIQNVTVAVAHWTKILRRIARHVGSSEMTELTNDGCKDT